MSLTILLVDDHTIVREGLRAVLKTEPDFQLLGEAADGAEALRLVERLHPEVLVLDLMLPGLNGFDVARQVLKRSPKTRIVILSMHSDVAYVREALRAGACAYVLKDASSAQLIKAIRAAGAGQRYLCPPLDEQAVDAYAQRAEGKTFDPHETLTMREREILHLTAEGNSGMEISARLHISPRTVESHRANLMRKLGVRNQRELVRYAVQRGIISKGGAEGDLREAPASEKTFQDRR